MNIRQIVRRPGQVQAPDCSAPANRSDFASGLIFFSSLGEQIKADVAKWAKLIRDANTQQQIDE